MSENSSNSSIPPSKDKNRPKRTKSLLKSSNKPLEGQPSHKGNTLKMVSNPDKVIDLVPNYCEDCGNSLTQIKNTLSSVGANSYFIP